MPITYKFEEINVDKFKISKLKIFLCASLLSPQEPKMHLQS